MKLVIKLLLTTVIFLVASTVKAHNPDISSIMLIEKEPGQWLIQLDASLSAFDQEMISVYGENAYSTPEEFKELVINHFRKQLSLSINSNNIKFGDAFLKLGHASTLVFNLIDVPVEMIDIIIENKGFKSSHHSKSMFKLVKEGVSDEQFKLNNANNYKVELTLVDNQLLPAEEASTNTLGQMFIGLLVAGFVGFHLVKNGFLNRLRPLKTSPDFQKNLSSD